MAFKLKVNARSGRTLAELEATADTSIEELKKLFVRKGSKVSLERIRFTTNATPAVTLAEGKKVGDYKLKDGDVIIFRDLGPQIAWKTVFIVEYLGPLLIYPFFYLQPSFIYGSHTSAPGYVQNLALIAWVAHYVKRELETLFVHRFSHATMPLFNIFKNSGYYWGMCAAVAYFVNHPLYTPPAIEKVYLGFAIFAVSEFCNVICHLMLRNLRPEGSTKRAIPKGFLFNLVSCPNYTFEILAWIGFSIATQAVTSWLFTLVGAGQMAIWAKGKHIRYLKEFNGENGTERYPRSRKILIPFIY